MIIQPWDRPNIDEVKARQLKKLDLSGYGKEKLEKILSGVFELEHLEVLNLGGNKLTDLPHEISRLHNLRALYLQGNMLSSLPISIGQLQNLVELNLNSNLFTKIPPQIFKLNKLIWLYLAENKITNIPNEISELKDLRELNLNQNLLQIVPDAINELKKLRNFDLRDNRLVNLPSQIIELEDLGELRLDKNPLISPPVEICLNGLDAIREYFHQLNQGQDYLLEAKILLLGEGAAGKTTLAKKIINPGYHLQNEPTTEGIDVLRWSFVAEDGKTFKFNIWDFGGQEIYHTTHQFFLTKRSLYILVADSRKEDTDFYYWLNTVELLSENSPLLIVNNEKEDRHREINERVLRGQFENLKEILSTNLSTNRGLEKTISAIKHYAKHLPLIGSVLPKSWVNVREMLEYDKRNYISIEEYLSICSKNGFADTNDSLQLSGYLHDIGVFLHFQDDSVLRKTVILKPKWGTDAVYQVLDDKNVIRNLGHFTRSDLDTIWDEYKYANMHDDLLQLMMKFRLCYQIPDTLGSYIAPQLLTENQPYYEWEKNENLFLHYTYEFMPKGILTQLIVVMHPYILEQRYVWKSGMLLEKEYTRAEVIEYYGKRELHVHVVGKHKKELLTIIMHELEKIHKSYKRLKYDKLISCNCEECKTRSIPYFYRFEHLQNFVEKNLNEIQCGVSGEMVNVRGLIDDIIYIDSRQIMGEGKNIMTKYEIHIGAGAKVEGSIVLGSEIKNSFVRESFNKISSANISDELKITLQQLSQAVDLLANELPNKIAEEVVDDLSKLIDESTKKSPNPKWYKISVEGLIKAAENLGKIGKPVIESATHVLTLLQR